MKIKFEIEEVKDIFLSIFVISLIFSVNNFKLELNKFFLLLPIISFSFFSKEIFQKYMAKKLGYSSRFKIYPLSSLLAIVICPVGIKIASSGYTQLLPYKFSNWKHGRKKFSVEDEGKIVLSGISILLFFAIFYFLLGFEFVKDMHSLIIMFNLLPILPFDGTKLLKWNFSIWAFLLFFNIILLIV